MAVTEVLAVRAAPSVEEGEEEMGLSTTRRVRVRVANTAATGAGATEAATTAGFVCSIDISGATGAT